MPGGGGVDLDNGWSAATCGRSCSVVGLQENYGAPADFETLPESYRYFGVFIGEERLGTT